MSGLFDDEVVADSEGEEEGFFMPNTQVPDTSIDNHYQPAETSIATFDTPLHPEPRSNISMFTERPVLGLHSDIVPSTADSRRSITDTSSISLASVDMPKAPSKPRSSKSAAQSPHPGPADHSTVSNDSPREKKGRPRPRPLKRSPQDPSSSKSVDIPMQIGDTSSNSFLDESIDPSYGMDIAERAKTRRRSAKSANTAPPPSIAILSPPPKRKRGPTRKEAPIHSSNVIELSSEDDEISLKAPPPKRPKAAQKKKAPRPPRSPIGPDRIPTPLNPARDIPDSSSQPSIPIPTSSLSIRHPASPLPPSDILGSPLTEPEYPPIAALSEPDSLDLNAPVGHVDDPPLFSPLPAIRKRKRAVILDDSEPEDQGGFDKPPTPPTFFASSSSPPRAEEPIPPRANSDPIIENTKTSKTTAKNWKDAKSDPLPVREEPKKKSRAKPKKKGPVTVEDAVDDGTQITVKRKGKGKKKEEVNSPKSREFIEDDVDELASGEVDNLTTGALPPDAQSNLPSSSGSGTQSKGTSDDASFFVEIEAPKSKAVKPKGKRRGKQVILDDDEEDVAGDMISKTIDSSEDPPQVPSPPPVEKSTKENHRPETPKPPSLSRQTVEPKSTRPSISSRYTIAPRTKPTPMSELIKRVNSLPGSPFASSPAARSGSAYSPYLKSSRSMLSRIAPLHPNRRTPPPPPPPPPPRKKSKKEIEREEKWEEELIESLGGLDAWVALSDADRRDLRRGKFEMEMNGWD